MRLTYKNASDFLWAHNEPGQFKIKWDYSKLDFRKHNCKNNN